MINTHGNRPTARQMIAVRSGTGEHRDDRDARIRRMRDRGWSADEISREVGLSVKTVSHITKGMPAPVRTPVAPTSLDWAAGAACSGMFALFEHVGRDSCPAGHPPGCSSCAGRVAAAARVCAGCPVRAECINDAYSASESYGAIRGGLVWSGGEPLVAGLVEDAA